MAETRHELVLPDLDLPGVPVVASVWHVPAGGDVSQGESVLEVLAGETIVDLPAPVDGTRSSAMASLKSMRRWVR